MDILSHFVKCFWVIDIFTPSFFLNRTKYKIIVAYDVFIDF